MSNFGSSPHTYHFCSLPLPICTTEPLWSNLFFSALDKCHLILLISILHEDCFDHISSSPNSSSQIPPSVQHPTWGSSFRFQSLSSLSQLRISPMPGFASAALPSFLKKYSSLLARAWIHQGSWATKVQEMARLKCSDIWGQEEPPAPPGLNLKKIKVRAFGAPAAKGHHKWVWTWGPRHEKVVKRLTSWYLEVVSNCKTFSVLPFYVSLFPTIHLPAMFLLF